MASIRRRCTQNSDMSLQVCDYSSDCSRQCTQDSCDEDKPFVRKKKQRRTIQGVLSGIHGAKKRKYGGAQNALMAALKSCAKKKDLNEGRRIHADILNWGLLENDVYLGNALVNLYVKCGALARAAEVLYELQFRDTITWNALIAGYAQCGYGKEALSCFDCMQREGITPDAVTFVCTLKACSCTGTTRKGKAIHAEIMRDNTFETNLFIGSALVDMYGKFGELAKAQRVFDELQSRNIVCWNALISGYVQYGCSEEALNCFQQMQREGMSPDPVTFVCILKACGNINAADKGREIHDEIVRRRLLRKDTFLGTALLDMYAKCGQFSKAMEVLDQLPSRNVVSWNALIAGYVKYNQCEEAVKHYDQMHREGLSPDAVTFVCVLKACAGIRAAEKGKEIHDEIVRLRLLEKNTLIGNALIDMYAKCGAVAKAQEVFDELQVRDVVSWTALIAGYTQHGHAEEALRWFHNMQHDGPNPNAITYVCILGACASMGAVDKGKEIHGEVVRSGLLENNVLLGNALVDMYAKCGALGKAQKVFDRLPMRDIVSWNALIAGYAQLGNDNIAYLFDKMMGGGVDPDRVTFTVILNACSDLGMLEKGQMCFERMRADYGMIPTLEHYTCLVDLFGRAGHFENAVAVVEKMPTSDYLPVWTSLLGACQKWGNVELGRLAFEHAIRLDVKHVATYVCMRNIYIGADMQDYADKIHAMKMENCMHGGIVD